MNMFKNEIVKVWVEVWDVRRYEGLDTPMGFSVHLPSIVNSV